MKYTKFTDKYIETINSSISELEGIYDENSDYIYCDEADIITEQLKLCCEHIKTFVIENIRREFWESCLDYDKILSHKHIFEVKFEKLLHCRLDEQDDYLKTYVQVQNDLLSFYYKQSSKGIYFLKEEKAELDKFYLNLTLSISEIKVYIISFLKEWEAMGTPFSQPISKTIIIENKIDANFSSKFKIASLKKTDFIKIVSAMYDTRMFETLEGNIATNKQDIFNELGRAFNADFTKYSTTLSQSKNVGEAVFMKPFVVIQKKAKEYYDKELLK